MFFDSLEDANFKLITGSAESSLPLEIDRELGGGFLVDNVAHCFEDGEVKIEGIETSRRSIVFVIKFFRPPLGINNDIIELQLIIDMLKRASACEVNVLAPYLPYARQDRKPLPHVPISAASIIQNNIQGAGADRLVCMDLHSPQIQGFGKGPFPIDNLWPSPTFTDYILGNNSIDPSNIAAVGPDVGALKRVMDLAGSLITELKTRFGKTVEVPPAVGWKVREKDNDNRPKVVDIIGGESLQGKDVIIFDDLIASGRSLVVIANEVAKYSPASITAAAAHGLFIDNALERIERSHVGKVAVTNSIPFRFSNVPFVDIINMKKPYSRVIENIVLGKSVSEDYPQT